MKITCLDLELNQPSGKIIQIGAVVGDTTNGVILDRYRAYVDPKEPLSEFIINLTGITESDISLKGTDLKTAYEGLRAMHIRHDSFINPLTWGGGDSQTVYDQLTLDERGIWPFGRRWIDAKTIHVTKMISDGKVLSGGLGTAMRAYNLKFQGRKHDALDDAENTWHIYYHMIYLMRHKNYG
jgi:inhibitor of KinA sporulation pathway (predicted exonuclease)